MPALVVPHSLHAATFVKVLGSGAGWTVGGSQATGVHVVKSGQCYTASQTVTTSAATPYG